jgi:hypothetical protein
MNCRYKKTITFFILLITGLYVSGCARTYNAARYASGDDFRRDFNSSAGNRSVTVELKDKSEIYIKNGVSVKNDTLFSISENGGITEETESAVPLSMIKSILNSGSESGTVELVLNNEEKVPAIVTRSGSDSLFFYRVNKSYTNAPVAPADKVLEVKYKNRRAGAAYGMTAGFFAGGVLGLGSIYIESTVNEKVENAEPPFKYFITGAAAGFVIGGVIGWLTGYGFTYQF